MSTNIVLSELLALPEPEMEKRLRDLVRIEA
jgi:hypothetical protein